MALAEKEIANIMARNKSLSYDEAYDIYRESLRNRGFKGGSAITSKPKGFAANPALAKKAGDLGRARRWKK